MTRSSCLMTGPAPVGGITEHERAFGSVLLALLGALGGEDLQEVVEVLDLRRRENISVPYLSGDPRVECRVQSGLGLSLVGWGVRQRAMTRTRPRRRGPRSALDRQLCGHP